MCTVRARVVRWVSDDQPGFVECRLVDADGKEHVLIEKVPMFDDGDALHADAMYPIDIVIDCRIISESEDAAFIELAHYIESVEGQREFRVARHLLASDAAQ